MNNNKINPQIASFDNIQQAIKYFVNNYNYNYYTLEYVIKLFPYILYDNCEFYLYVSNEILDQINIVILKKLANEYTFYQINSTGFCSIFDMNKSSSQSVVYFLNINEL